jgi:prepilin-type processing-associated H-X9-DG protein
MTEKELLIDTLRRLNRIEIPYMLTGSMASNYWGMGNVLFADGHVESVGTNNPFCYSKAGDFF